MMTRRKVVNRILEIGCGEGDNMNFLASNLDNVVTGIDLSPQIVKLAKKRHPNLNIHQMNAEKLKFKDQDFDTVYAFEVLEHVDNLNAVIKEIYRVLRPGGKLILSVPYEKSEYLLLKIRPNYFKEIHHVRIFKQNDMRKLMKKHGFKLLKQKGRNSIYHIYVIYKFVTTKKSNTQLAIGDWRDNIFSAIVYSGVAFFRPFILNTPGRYIPIWVITIPIGYVVSYFGDNVFPKSIYYEFVRSK